MQKKPRKTLTNKVGEVRGLTREDFKGMRRLKDVRPDIVAAFKRGRGRPKLDNPKQEVKIRLDTDVLAWLKAAGKGYQTRLNAILRDAMDA
jgi:uncharacterized protein (DUF4415 family)